MPDLISLNKKREGRRGGGHAIRAVSSAKEGKREKAGKGRCHQHRIPCVETINSHVKGKKKRKRRRSSPSTLPLFVEGGGGRKGAGQQPGEDRERLRQHHCFPSNGGKKGGKRRGRAGQEIEH